jgi:ABC-2 type transport system permease protein
VLNVLAVARRDLGGLLRWPVLSLGSAVLALGGSLLGYLPQLSGGGGVTMAPVFAVVALGSALLVPLLTMRLLAHQRREGTLELLLGSPLRAWELVVGKWLAGFGAFLAAAVAFTLVHVVLIAVQQPAGARSDLGAFGAGYVGLLLVGAAWVAVGLLVSSLTRSRVVAALAGIAVLLVLQYALGALAGLLSPPLSDVLQYLGAADHARSFGRGQVVLRDVVYYLSLVAGALWIAVQVVGARWSR